MSKEWTKRAAQIISVVGHPFVLLPVAIMLVALQRLDPRRAVIVVATVSVLALLPMILYILRQMRHGRWGNFDVSVRSDRPRLYFAAVLLTAITVAVLRLTGQPPFIVRGTVAALVLLVVAWFVNLTLKLSLHAAFSALAAWMIYSIAPIAGVVIGAAVIVIGWSRVRLDRHTASEVAAGTILGAIVGAALVFLP